MNNARRDLLPAGDLMRVPVQASLGVTPGEGLTAPSIELPFAQLGVTDDVGR